MAILNADEYRCFEDIKTIRSDGSEFWFARELAPILDYRKWDNFNKVINRAMIACKNSGHSIDDHFPDVRKMIEMPSKPRKSIIEIGFPEVRKTKSIIDYELSRYACYLIVQNGDPRKEVIALGQTYFAIQTYRQEVAERFNQLDEDNKRLVIRGDIKQWNQMLAEAAHMAGVITNEEFAVFQNSGYMGLYGGMTNDEIHSKKGLAVRDKILDFMGSEELIANLFRISQTESKLKREKTQGASAANEAHYVVGKEVRTAILRVGGTMPEDLPIPDKSISQIEREQINKLKKRKKPLMLDE